MWKLPILGDHAWVRHYHPSLDVRVLPEYVFVHSQDPRGLYTAFYQYFTTRWNDPAIPEYDLLTGELVYPDRERREVGGVLSRSSARPDDAPHAGMGSLLRSGRSSKALPAPPT